MKAVVWHGKEDVRVDHVGDPQLVEPTDAIVRITSTAICGSDLHLYSQLGPVMREGDILGHEPMGIVEAHPAGRPRREPRGTASRRSIRRASTTSARSFWSSRPAGASTR